MRAAAAVVLFGLFAPFVSLAQSSNEKIEIEDLRCRGNVATSCDFILGYVYLDRGDPLDETEVRNAQLRVATLRMFESVRIYLEKGSARGKALLIIEVGSQTKAGDIRIAPPRQDRIQGFTAGE